MDRELFARKVYNELDTTIKPSYDKDYNFELKQMAIKLMSNPRSYSYSPKELVVISSVLGEDKRNIDVQMEMFLDKNVMNGMSLFSDFYHKGAYLNYLYDNYSEVFLLYKFNNDKVLLNSARSSLNEFIQACNVNELKKQFEDSFFNTAKELGL